MITSSPCFQLTGVATLCSAVSWIEFEQPQHLVEVAAGRHRIDQHRLDQLVGADQVDRADGLVGRRGAALRACAGVGREHVVELGDVEIVVGDDRILTVAIADAVDVLQPATWSSTGSTDRPMTLALRLLELGLELGEIAEFGGAHRREVLGVGEQHAPAVAEPFVEADRPLVESAFEVGGHDRQCVSDMMLPFAGVEGRDSGGAIAESGRVPTTGAAISTKSGGCVCARARRDRQALRAQELGVEELRLVAGAVVARGW